MQSLTRRDMLSTLCIAGAAGWGALSPFPLSAVTLAPDDPEHRLWSRLVGQRFRLRGAAETSTADGQHRGLLRLEEATLRAFRNDVHRPSHLRPAAISLLFSAPTTAALPGAIYTLSHPQLGDVTLFLNPIPRHEYPDGVIYEAVLN